MMKPYPKWETRCAAPTSLTRTSVLAMMLGVALAAAQFGCQDSNTLHHELAGAEPAPRTEARLRVQVEPVRLARLASADHITGTVRAFHRATVTAETQGRVLGRHVESGTSVEAGQLLIELESSRLELEVRRSTASLHAAKTVLSHAKRDFARAEQLFEQNTMSIQRYDDLQHAVNQARDEIALAEVARDTAKRNLDDARITAPFSGTVDSLMVDVGDFVSPGNAVATLVDLSRVRIFGGVTAREAARLEPGRVAQVSFADLGGTTFEATLQSVGRVAGSNDGTYEIEWWMDPGATAMRDGLVAQIAMKDLNEEPALLARRAAILHRDGHPEVFVVAQTSGGSVAQIRRLRTGRSQGDWIEILDGLAEGDGVIWDGHFALDEGASVIVDGAPEITISAAAGSSE
jgi:membrane fusion protein (multidrug efflux system)